MQCDQSTVHSTIKLIFRNVSLVDWFGLKCVLITLNCAKWSVYPCSYYQIDFILSCATCKLVWTEVHAHDTMLVWDCQYLMTLTTCLNMLGTFVLL